ncbi:MAG: class I SAM-dependent methyltransferase [Gammaproteobacteria bacterium]|nr:MAG: class I SAM-dependent methyltransferase [Gammaproteobacteria bacterium]
MYNRQNPSARYRALLEQYRNMHREGEKFLGLAPEKTFPGEKLLPQAARIKRLIERTGAQTLLDYGSGKGQLYQRKPVEVPNAGSWPSIQAYWGLQEVRCYDPCYEPFNRLPEEKFDGVICTDVLEHCPEEDVPWILDELFGYARRFVFANAACYPARKHLPTGENAHCTIREPAWWRERLRETSARHPGVLWEVWVQSRVEIYNGHRMVEQKLTIDLPFVAGAA